ncbi:MAG: hypothetical protein RMM58_10765 [Chloroflexota bacterium]|nr:hypothetical protein [Dehalococcoidia bacterium]MDW8254347.1 hypothetical protein [Chloroflexota bacterium]
MSAAWKVDPALRDRHEGEVTVAVQLLAAPTDHDTAVLARFGLSPSSSAGGLWTGRVAAASVAAIAALPSVGYVYDADHPSLGGVASRRPPLRPRRPAKRGHTKLPPRRPAR